MTNEKTYDVSKYYGRINKDNAKISTWDKIYCELLEKILMEGTETENRTGINTISIEGVNFKLEDIENNFPILESKKVFMKNALSEILWIHQAQSNDVRWLEERNNPIWEEWKIDSDGIYRVYEPTNEFEDKEVEVVRPNGTPYLDPYGDEIYTGSKKEGKTIKKAIYYGEEWANTIGTAYGWINNKFKRPQYVLNTLKENPNDRRMIISLWQDEYIQTGTLPPCVWATEWKVKGDTLNLYVHQRSADVPLGLPFNVSQYAALLKMFAKASNLKAGTLNYSIMDAHIYKNQIDGILEQLNRYEIMKDDEEFIKNKSFNQIWHKYCQLIVEQTELKKYINNNPKDKNTLEKYKEVLEKLEILDLMLGKEKPTLQLADKDNFFEFSNEVNNDKEYLKENPTGNEDIKLLNYSSLSPIKMPIAQ